MTNISVPFTGSFSLGATSYHVGLEHFCLGTDSKPLSAEILNSYSGQKGESLFYCTIDRFFHNNEIKNLENELKKLNKDLFDAFIVSDIGVLETVKSVFSEAKVHLSSFANCLNHTCALKFYRLGFDRIILGHEVSIKDIAGIHEEVPQLELEVPVYGSMCMSYSGRKLLSTHFGEGKTIPANLALEEEQREGSFFPIEEKDGFITIKSSRQLTMTDKLSELSKAGITVFRVENSEADDFSLQNALSLIKGENTSCNENSKGFFYSKGPIE